MKERNENKLKNQYLYRAIIKMTQKEEKYRRYIGLTRERKLLITIINF